MPEPPGRSGPSTPPEPPSSGIEVDHSNENALSPAMGSPYTNTKLIGGKPSKLQKSFRLMIFLTAIGISCAATYTLIAFMRTEENITTVIELPYGSLSELTDPEVFTQAYLSVNCNAATLENIQTIRVKGHMVNGDEKQAFSLTKKRPDQVLFTIDRASHEVTFGVSGNTVWRRTRAPQRKDQFAILEGQEAEAWLRQRRFFDHIISSSQGEGRILGIEITIWEETDCLKVSCQNTNGGTIEILIAAQTMHPIAELQTLSDGTIKQTMFSDYRDVDGMLLPFKIESLIDGEPSSLIIVDTASLNSGVLSKLFDIPEELLAQ